MIRNFLHISALLATFWGTPAFACSYGCFPATMSADKGILPSNAAGIAFSQVWSFDETTVTLSDSSGEELAFQLVVNRGFSNLIFDEPLQQFQTYELRVETICAEGPNLTSEFSFETGGEVAFPTSLGILSHTETVRETLTLEANDACWTEEDVVYVDVALNLSEDAAGWEDALLFWTEVNGELWAPPTIGQPAPPGHSWVGKGKDRIYMECRTYFFNNYTGSRGRPRLYDGPQEIVMKAWSPDRREVLETEPIVVEMSCEKHVPEAEDLSCATTRGSFHHLPLLLIFGWLRRRPKPFACSKHT